MCQNQPHRTKYQPAFAAFTAASLFLGAGCGRPPGASDKTVTGKSTTPVVTTSVRTGTVSRIVTVTGSLAALQDVALSAKQGGRVASIEVREGDSVVAGQIVARISAADLESQVRSAEAAVLSARAKVAQAEAAYNQQRTTTETTITSARAAYNQQIETASAQVRSAKAALVSARASLSTVQEGARPEERTQTQATLASAEANLKKATSDYARYQKLHAAGAVSDAELDQYANVREVAQASLNSAHAGVELQQKGNRHQEVERAQQQVRQAEETLQQANAAQATNAVRKADLEAALAARAQNAVKLSDVQAARAALAEAQNSLTIARQAVQDAVVRSPIAGRVSSRAAEPGQVVASGATLLHVVALDSVYFEPSVPNSAFGQVKVGQPISVHIDAFPGRKFVGVVSRIYPEGSQTSRTFPIRVTLQNKTGVLRPQMFAQGQITTEEHRNVVLIPREAILGSTGSEASSITSARFFTVENGTAREWTKTLGLPSADGAWVEVPGIPSDTQVVTLGQRTLTSGQAVTATSSAAKTTKTSAGL